MEKDMLDACVILEDKSAEDRYTELFSRYLDNKHANIPKKVVCQHSK